MALLSVINSILCQHSHCKQQTGTNKSTCMNQKERKINVTDNEAFKHSHDGWWVCRQKMSSTFGVTMLTYGGKCETTDCVSECPCMYKDKLKCRNRFEIHVLRVKSSVNASPNPRKAKRNSYSFYGNCCWMS